MSPERNAAPAIVAALLCLGAGALQAGEFSRAFDGALQADPAYRAARAELASTQQNLPIARAGLLPNLSLSISDAKVDGSRTVDNPPFAPVNQSLDYRSPSQSLNLRAPLYNREAAKKIEAAQVQERYALAVFSARQFELLDRLAKAWLERVAAEQNFELALAQDNAALLQLTLAQRRFALGEGTRLEIADAEAGKDLAAAQVSEAGYLRNLAGLTLRQITGLPPAPQGAATPSWVDAAMPASGAGLEALKPEALTDLLSRAEANSPSLTARRHAVEAAQIAVERARSGHYPRLDFVASLSQSSNESLSTVNQSARQQSLGLQLNLPLYSGGAVNASVTQALADVARAEAELASEQQSVTRELTRLYFGASQGLVKLAAQQKSLSSAKLALEAATRGLATGFTSQSDVVQAQRRLAQTRLDWLQGVQEFLMARVRLQLRTSADALQTATALDTWLTTAFTLP